MGRAHSESARQGLGKGSERASLSASTGSQGGTESQFHPQALDRPRSPRCPWGRPRDTALKFCQALISRRLWTHPETFQGFNITPHPSLSSARESRAPGTLLAPEPRAPKRTPPSGAGRRRWAVPGAARRPARDSGSAARAGARAGPSAATFGGTRAAGRTPGAAAAWAGLGEERKTMVNGEEGKEGHAGTPGRKSLKGAVPGARLRSSVFATYFLQTFSA